MNDIDMSMRIAKMLKQVMDAIKQNAESDFKELNLTGTQGMVMATLGHFGKTKISNLSDKMGLSNSTVSGIVDRLEKQGFVERIRCKNDRRVVYVDVTPEFRKIAEKHFCCIEKKYATMMEDASEEEIKKIFEGLQLLKNILDKNIK